MSATYYADNKGNSRVEGLRIDSDLLRVIETAVEKTHSEKLVDLLVYLAKERVIYGDVASDKHVEISYV